MSVSCYSPSKQGVATSACRSGTISETTSDSFLSTYVTTMPKYEIQVIVFFFLIFSDTFRES